MVIVWPIHHMLAGRSALCGAQCSTLLCWKPPRATQAQAGAWPHRALADVLVSRAVICTTGRQQSLTCNSANICSASPHTVQTHRQSHQAAFALPLQTLPWASSSGMGLLAGGERRLRGCAALCAAHTPQLQQGLVHHPSAAAELS